MRPYTKQAERVIEIARQIAGKLGHNYAGTEHLLVGMRREFTGVAGQILSECGLSEEKMIDIIQRLIAPETAKGRKRMAGLSPRLEAVLEDGAAFAEAYQSDAIGTEHLLLAIMRDGECMASRVLVTMDAPMQKIYMLLMQVLGSEPEEVAGSKLKPREEMLLPQYSTDLTRMAAEGKLDPVIGREKEIDRIIQILSRRNKNNPCLIGEPGVGKSAIVEGLAARIQSGQVPDTLKDKRLLTLDLSGMVAGSKYRGEFEERIKGIIAEVQQEGNILLFMDEVHTLIGAGGAEGSLDAANILKPALARSAFQLIGATTISEYRKHIEKDAALERRFQPVMVEEPDQAMTLEILKGLRRTYEEFHKLIIEDEALLQAVQLSERYITDRNLPDKAIDVLDEACSKVHLRGFHKGSNLKGEIEEKIRLLGQEREEALIAGDMEKAAHTQKEYEKLRKKLGKLLHQEQMVQEERARWGVPEGVINGATGEKRDETGAPVTQTDPKQSHKILQLPMVTAEDVAEVVSLWTKIPVQKLTEKEGARLAHLEDILHKRVIGQEEAVSAVARAVKRGRAGMKDPARPVGSFLFLGPTGVGKTELSKALAEALFQTEDSLIRVDMSEYMEKHSVSKMIGSPPGYVGHEEGGQLSEKVRRNPYSVVLFDEIEKAHPDVFNILLQVLDDGRITDSQGRLVDFKNTVIIMTSNAGAQAIIEPKRLGFAAREDAKKDYADMKGNVMEEVRRIFKPEFLNRLDEIIVFHQLNDGDLRKIANLLLKNVAARAKAQNGMTLTFRESVKKHIVEKGSDRKFGARPLKRAIQTEIEDPLADAILLGQLKAGDTAALGIRGGKLTIDKKQG